MVMPDMASTQLDALASNIDGFVHELARLRLLAFLSVLKKADFVYLLRQSGLSRGNLSVQMSKLSDAGLVEIEKSFVDNRPRTVYSLTPGGRKALQAYKLNMMDLLDTLQV
jgi:DNA-binding MarR family transcriptional regulator